MKENIDLAVWFLIAFGWVEAVYGPFCESESILANARLIFLITISWCMVTTDVRMPVSTWSNYNIAGFVSSFFGLVCTLVSIGTISSKNKVRKSQISSFIKSFEDQEE